MNKQKLTEWLVILLILFWGLVLLLCSCRSTKLNKTKTETKIDSVATHKKDSSVKKEEEYKYSETEIKNGSIQVVFSDSALIELIKKYDSLPKQKEITIGKAKIKIPLDSKVVNINFGNYKSKDSSIAKKEDIRVIDTGAVALKKEETVSNKQKETKRFSLLWLLLLLIPTMYVLNRKYRWVKFI